MGMQVAPHMDMSLLRVELEREWHDTSPAAGSSPRSKLPTQAGQGVTAPTLAPAPRPLEDQLVFVPDCPLLGLQRAHLERRGFRLTPIPSPKCSVLVFCGDHVQDYTSAATIDAPKLVVGADPPPTWRRAERLMAPLLPIDLENRIVSLLRTSSAAAGRTYRLLMVEDDATVRAAAEAAFEEAGFEVRSVDGFAMVQEEMNRRPDLILMDLNLPGLSGEKLGEILRRQGVPIAIFSSETAERLEAARARVGAIAAFSKGTPLHKVAAAIRRHLEGVNP